MAAVFSRQARGLALALAIFATGSAGLRAADENVSPDADFTVRQITQQLFEAKAGERLDYAGRDLTYLDLSGLDFQAGEPRAHGSLRGQIHEDRI